MNVSSGSLSERIAQQLVCRRLSVPAIALLDAHKPLSFVGAQLLLVLQPFLDILVPRRWIDEGIALLTDPKQWDALLQQLESSQLGASVASPHHHEHRR